MLESEETEIGIAIREVLGVRELHVCLLFTRVKTNMIEERFLHS